MTVALTALVTALAALALTRWMRGVARAESRWLHSGVHVVLAALGGAGAAALAAGPAELVAFALLAVVAALLVVIDLAVHRLPDVVVGPTYPALLAALTAAAALSGDWGQLGRAAAGAVALLAAYLALALLSPAGLGLGDVKLSGLLGAFLAWFGWSHVLVGTLAAFLLNGVVAAVALLAGRAARSSDIPFGPSMVAGAVVGAAWTPVVLGGLG